MDPTTSPNENQQPMQFRTGKDSQKEVKFEPKTVEKYKKWISNASEKWLESLDSKGNKRPYKERQDENYGYQREPPVFKKFKCPVKSFTNQPANAKNKVQTKAGEKGRASNSQNKKEKESNENSDALPPFSLPLKEAATSTKEEFMFDDSLDELFSDASFLDDANKPAVEESTADKADKEPPGEVFGGALDLYDLPGTSPVKRRKYFHNPYDSIL